MYLEEEVGIILPKFVILYDKRVISELFENPELIINASQYPIEAKVFDRVVKLYYIQ